MNAVKKLLYDDRKIVAIYHGPSSFVVDGKHITEIIPYAEDGQMSFVPWFAIYKNDFLWMRIDAAGWGVEYEVPDEKEF